MSTEPKPDRNVIQLDLVSILVPTVKWEKDMLNGGAEEVTTIKFAVRNLSKGLQAELAAQAFSGQIANLSIRLLQPSIYMLKEVDPVTGEVATITAEGFESLGDLAADALQDVASISEPEA